MLGVNHLHKVLNVCVCVCVFGDFEVVCFVDNAACQVRLVCVLCQNNLIVMFSMCLY